MTFFMFVASYINVFTYFVIRDIGYPFKAILLDVGHGIENVDMKDISPFTLITFLEAPFDTLPKFL